MSSPTFYGVHALQMAIFYSSTDGYGRDAAVMAGTALVTLALGVTVAAEADAGVMPTMARRGATSLCGTSRSGRLH